MVASKGKHQLGINAVAEDARKVVKNFKVFADNEKIKIDVGSLRKTLPPKKGALLTAASDSKEGSKFGVKIKAIEDVNIKRRPLADLSNKQTEFSRNVTSAGFKPMRTSLPLTKGALLTARTDLKEGSKFGVKIKAIEDVNVKRRPLADLSNKQTELSRNDTSTGSKPMRTSLPLKKGALTAASNSKEGSKFGVKINGKFVSYAIEDVNVKRRSLDVLSNKQNEFSRNATSTGSKPMIAVDPNSRTVYIPSRKCSPGRATTSQRFSYFHATRKADCRTNTKNLGDRSEFINSRRGAKNSLGSMRKSLPVLTGNRANFSYAKNNEKGLEKAKRNTGLSGKAKMNKDVVPQVSSCRNSSLTIVARDGFISMAAKNQTNVRSHHWSRKSGKPTVKTAISVSNGNRTLRSKCTLAAGKFNSTAAMASKKQKESERSSLLEKLSVVVSHEANHEHGCESNNNLHSKKLDAADRGKSGRRRSYTSSLMARSKEEVSCIDDYGNQLEVAEYIDEIYQFYWVSETENLSLANYMSIQTEITPKMRGILINWLIEVHLRFELMSETLYLMVILLDQYLCQIPIKKNEMQLVGLTALLLASKYEDSWPPRIKDLLSISAESYTRDQMLLMEKLILKKLKFRLNAPTPYVFLLRFLKAAQSDLEHDHLAFYLIELSLVEYEVLKFKPSMLCASAIYVARSTLQISPAWTPLLVKHARYEVSQIRDCAEMVLGFQKAARNSDLKVTYEKYMSPDLSSVAALKPLDELPL
ncbi:cyclin-A2-1 isoform X2 [Mercurialis annua]|uniref:cyclin-A2-1 isoform X2 n=1 Tax=Mercurialis annua TaxID=3986 RepID=UPI0021604C98|nr:cyclin-A2-1 isoform X2 [Mercurialis annua]